MKQVKKYLFIFLSLILLASISLLAQVKVPIKDGTLGAKQWGSSIRVTWTSESEGGLNHYELYRSTVKDGPYTDCIRTSIAPLGDNHTYTIDDNCDLLKTESNLYFYKVKAVYSNGTVVFSDAVGTVYSSTSSTAKRTWGSIKAMFR